MRRRVRLTGRGLLICALALAGCRGERPANLGVSDGALAPCPPTPNCVSSDASDGEHRADALELVVDAEAGWRAVREVVASLPRATVIEDTGDYMHVEHESAVFRFVDDLELHLRSADGVVAVRSASRLGRSDLGVNGGRVEDLRARLRALGVVR